VEIKSPKKSYYTESTRRTLQAFLFNTGEKVKPEQSLTALRRPSSKNLRSTGKTLKIKTSLSVITTIAISRIV
jgi:hypothetical protein